MAEQTTKSPCLIHFDGRRGPLTAFTDVSFKKFLLFREQWVALDGEQKKSGGKITQCCKRRRDTNESRKPLLPQRMLFQIY